ncbi:MAG: TauD/TfdA family dioxygenase [Alphaproteobacteria bacterium]|jgi:taurine dioxygenase|nr:TauD/TfdA family dioxygenase [Alphaproteobacteria bacterium]
MPLTTRPLTPAFGLEILDVDLRAPTDELIAEIDALWVEHPVLLIRDQLLDEAQQIAFSSRLGEINIHVRTDIRSRSHPEVVMVSNLRLENGDNIGALASGEAKWHTDSCYKPKPDTGSLLYALEVPEDGGKTAWANTQLAYDALSDEMRARVEGRRGEYAYNIFDVDITQDGDVKDIREKTPDVVHPMVLTQPGSGRKGLYLDPLQTYGVEGMESVEGRALLDELSAHITRPEFVFEHTWRRGDIVLWDNCRVLHRREPFDPMVPRLLKRTTIFLPPERYPVPFTV